MSMLRGELAEDRHKVKHAGATVEDLVEIGLWTRSMQALAGRA